MSSCALAWNLKFGIDESVKKLQDEAYNNIFSERLYTRVRNGLGFSKAILILHFISKWPVKIMSCILCISYVSSSLESFLVLKVVHKTKSMTFSFFLTQFQESWKITSIRHLKRYFIYFENMFVSHILMNFQVLFPGAW